VIEKTISLLITTAVAVLCAAALAWWVTLSSSTAMELRAAPEGSSTRPAAPTARPVRIEGTFEKFALSLNPVVPAGAWPRFRGPAFDNVAAGGVRLAESWPEGGPPVLWSVDLGSGYAGPAVLGGRVFLLDYDEERGGDALRCFSLKDGRELWRRWYKVRVKRNHGMSRTVPAVTDKWAVTVGPKCHVMCVETDTGRFLWGIDLVREYGTKVPMWYTGQCPLIDDGVAVIAPGGDSLMIGVDCATGRVLWRTPNPAGWKMSHTSIVPMTLGGKRTYVYAALGGLAGVSAEKPDRGALLWQSTEWKHAVVAPSPVDVGGGRVFLTAGYGVGSAMLEVKRAGEEFSVRTLYRLDRKVFACEHHTPVFSGGHLFAVLPKDAGPGREQLACMDLDGRQLWTSGKGHRFGLGPFMVADGKILALSEDGELTLARATHVGYEQLARARVLEGREAWAPMALAGGRLLLRDIKRMICVDVSAEGVKP
jgi:outer membrane protein assembly factor BamB